MSKANEKSLDWLPKRKDGRKKCYRCNDDDIRSIYARGYRKAEKDLELTWKELALIRLAFDATEADINLGNLKISPMTKEYYQEVLKRFKDFKERKEK